MHADPSHPTVLSSRRLADAPMPASAKPPALHEYHGTTIIDPYAWLEDLEHPDVRAWVAQQNQRTHAYFAGIPALAHIRQELTARWNYPRYGVPIRRGDWYFFYVNQGLQAHSILSMQRGLQSKPRVLLDPNTLSADGSIALGSTFFNRDGTLMVYGLSRNGSDWQTLHIRRVEDGGDYPEVLQWSRHSRVAWHPDSSGFYYNRYPEPGTVAPEDETHFERIYFHQLGTPQAEDRLIFEQPEAKELGCDPFVSDDGRYLLLRISQGTDPRTRWYFREIQSSGDFLRLLDKADASYRFIGNVDTLFYFLTTLDAPRGRVVAIDVHRPEREHWREILPQQTDAIERVEMVYFQLAVVFLHEVHHKLTLYSLAGQHLRDIPLPCSPGSISAIAGKTEDSELFFSVTSFLIPAILYRYDFVTATLTVFREACSTFDASPYTVSQVFVASNDGTRVPMFLVHRRDLVRDGTNPTILTGYGGFRSSQLPAFSTLARWWIEQGGIYALANIRGGSEYGEQWHQAGILEHKQQVFDDFIAAAQWLIAQRYTSSARLAISGGSNGGLLVAACMVQRPDLFGAVICRVPVIDMLRYHRWGVGHYWTAEYGNAEADPAHFRFLRAYAPLLNLIPGTSYPPTLILTAESDDRVSPAHALKFAAALQEATANTDDAGPILLTVQSRTGHGAGKPTEKIIEQASLTLAFLCHLFQISLGEQG